jgi:DNA repair exonuclease SbcCD ATPase subunit
MIPQRVKLSGFLSYKEPQEVRFDTSRLWMLTGPNGSGKSSIFDALTYALFGCHRGGTQNSTELINRGSSTLAVEFDFLLDGRAHRIHRTLRELKSGPKSTCQVLRQEPGGEWAAVSGTNIKTAFDAWISEKIGLDYNTFTSSVLLLQGKAEKLLDSTPTGRAGVLARIVDLERYQKLHARADEKRRELKLVLENVSNQLAGTKAVSDEEFAAAEAAIANAARLRDETQARIDRLQECELKALRWADAVAAFDTARDKLTHSEAILGHAVAIEKDFARLRELHDVLPAVTTIVTERGRIAHSNGTTETLRSQRSGKADARRETDHAGHQSRDQRDGLKKTLAKDEARQAKLNGELRELAGVLEKVKHVDDAEAEVRRLAAELKRFAPTLDAEIIQHEADVSRLAAIAPVLPLLERLRQDRADLLQAMNREAAARAGVDALLAEGKRAKDEHEKRTAELAEAAATREAAAAAMAEARALAQQAKKLAEAFDKLSDEKTCAACGQELTADHYRAEKKRRGDEAKAAEKKSAEFTKQAAAAREAEDAASAAEAVAKGTRDKLRDEFTAKTNEQKQAAADMARLAASCKQGWLALPDAFRLQVSEVLPEDWTVIAYPDLHHLAALRADVQGLEAVRKKLREATQAMNDARIVRSQYESACERLEKAKHGLPSSGSATLRAEFAAKQAEDATLTKDIAAAKAGIAKLDADVDRFQRRLGELDRDLVEIDGKLALEESTRKQSQEAIDRAKKSLPAAWQGPLETAGFSERAKWQDEFDKLTAKGTEQKHTQLQAARNGLDTLRAEIEILRQERDAFPEEARRSPESVREELSAARDECDYRNEDFMLAQRQQGVLEEFRRRRAELSEKFLVVDAEHNRCKRLAELLGRDRLQRHLVRKAERQIVDCANGVLDRLSDGALFLKLVGKDDGASAEKALELECINRGTGGAPINVAFISGSQRFRVAVALALGIGQYASRQFRPIESVIIDEGFGCLDRSNRQVMIQELQNLRGHLKSILLVSHQEEFADAFPDGYKFELVDGATRVSRK